MIEVDIRYDGHHRNLIMEEFKNDMTLNAGYISDLLVFIQTEGLYDRSFRTRMMDGNQKSTRFYKKSVTPRV